MCLLNIFTHYIKNVYMAFTIQWVLGVSLLEVKVVGA